MAHWKNSFLRVYGPRRRRIQMTRKIFARFTYFCTVLSLLSEDELILYFVSIFFH